MNEALLKQIYLRQYRKVLHFFRRRGCSPDEGQDLAQETFLEAFRSRHTYRGDANESQWVYGIAANVFRRACRHRAALKRQADVVPLVPETEPAEGAQDGVMSSWPPPTSVDVLMREEIGLVTAAIDRLPERRRECLLLRFRDEHSYKEIAELLQISPGTVKATISQAREQLRDMVGKDHGHGAGRVRRQA